MNTAQDIVDHLLTLTGGGAQDGEHRSVRAAVVHGVREVMQVRDWLYHVKTGEFITGTTSTTATITSGSNQITVADASNFGVGRLVSVSPAYFAINPRITAVNGSTITLDGSAIASGSGIAVYPQVYYDLPADLRNIDALVTNTVGTLHCYITPQEWQRLEINTRGAGEPYYYTVMRSDVNPDRFQIRFVGVPTNSVPVYYTYRYIPSEIQFMGYERSCRQGTASCASFTVTGDGTAFRSAMVGCAIRFGTATNNPEPVGSLTPYRVERTIEAVANTTSLTVNISAGVAAGSLYSISNVIDASPSMWTAILSAAEMWYARLAGKPVEGPAAMFNRDLKIAMENDVVSPMSGWPSAGRITRTARTQGWHSPILPDLT